MREERSRKGGQYLSSTESRGKPWKGEGVEGNGHLVLGNPGISEAFVVALCSQPSHGFSLVEISHFTLLSVSRCLREERTGETRLIKGGLTAIFQWRVFEIWNWGWADDVYISLPTRYVAALALVGCGRLILKALIGSRCHYPQDTGTFSMWPHFNFWLQDPESWL